ncbi:MAG: energy transducer TonB, partial [Spirulinaceae cyanobacterium]
QPTPEEIKKIEKNLNQKLAQLRKKDAHTEEQRQQNEAYRKKLEEAQRQQNEAQRQINEEKQRLAKRAEQLRQQRARQNQNDSKYPNPTPNQDNKTDNTPENTTTVTSNNDRTEDKEFESGQTIPKIALGNGIPKTQEVSPQLREQLTYQPTLTSQEAATKEFISWGQSVEEQTGTFPNISEQNISINGDYPQDACLGEKVIGKRIEGSATYGVVVDPEGKIVGQPTLIQSAGYPVLNQQAMADLQSSQQFAKNPQLTPYLVEVTYPYNPQVCPDN